MKKFLTEDFHAAKLHVCLSPYCNKNMIAVSTNWVDCSTGPRSSEER